MTAAATKAADLAVDSVLVPPAPAAAKPDQGIRCAADLYPHPLTVGKRCMLHEDGRTMLEGGRVICSGNK